MGDAAAEHEGVSRRHRHGGHCGDASCGWRKKGGDAKQLAGRSSCLGRLRHAGKTNYWSGFEVKTQRSVASARGGGVSCALSLLFPEQMVPRWPPPLGERSVSRRMVRAFESQSCRRALPYRECVHASTCQAPPALGLGSRRIQRAGSLSPSESRGLAIRGSCSSRSSCR